MKLLYVTFFLNLFIIQTQVCIFWMLSLLGPALKLWLCLLYTSDAADEEDSVDLGGRRIIKKKTSHTTIS